MKSSNISEVKEAMPTKSGVHVFDINPYLHEFFELILFDSNFLIPMDYTMVRKENFAKLESS